MARMHARRQGRSGSSRPVSGDLSFVKAKEKDIVALIVKMAKEDDMKPSAIGLVLRDEHAIPSVKAVIGKSISDVLKDNKLDSAVPEDLHSLVSTANKLKKHLEKNTRDVHNKRSLLLIESKIRRLSNYYKKAGRIPQSWSYNN